MNETQLVEVARRIRSEMDRRRMDREELRALLASQGLSLSVRQISNIRNEKHLSEATVVAIAEALGIVANVAPGVDEVCSEFEARASLAEAQFAEATAGLVAAEKELDAAVGRLAELYATEQLVAGGDHRRPTPREIAEMHYYIAMHDTREWTRYEMALVEFFAPDYPQDVTLGSTYADLSSFRHRVGRIPGPPTRLELEDAERIEAKRAQLRNAAEASSDDDEYKQPTRLTPAYRWVESNEQVDESGEMAAHDELHTIQEEQEGDEFP